MSAPFEIALFDLDGTLTDPAEGMTKSIQYALERMNAPVLPAVDLLWCIGPPIQQSFARLLDSDDPEQIQKAIQLYRERYATIGLFENVPYPGVMEMLTTLQAAGITLYVATSKPVVFANRILGHFELKPFFQAIYGSELDGVRAEKWEVIAYLLETEKIPLTKTIMIGDRKHDILGARRNELASIGVLYGYGSEDELRGAGADWLCYNPLDIVKLLQF